MMPPPIPVTREQIVEVLDRLRGQCQYMYYGPRAVELMGRQVIDYDGHSFTLSVLPDGLFEMRIVGTDATCRFAAISTVAAPTKPGNLDNLTYRALIKGEPHPDYHDWFERASIFVLSAFQRTNAFVFFARMEDVTLEKIATDLAGITPKATGATPSAPPTSVTTHESTSNPA